MERPQSPSYITELARRLRTDQTSAEERLWDCVRNRQFANAKFRRQHPIGRYIADLYCHEGRLVIELEGGIHQRQDQQEYDEVRQTSIEQQGLKVLKFSNQEVMYNLEEVLSKIENALTPDPSPPGRGANEA